MFKTNLPGHNRMNEYNHGSESGGARGYAAIFVDFENVFYFLQNQYAALPDLTEYALELLRNLRAYLEEELNLNPILRYAYADIERLSAMPLGSLYLMGIEVRNVLGTQHKNAADMRLCIDAMQALYTRPDIGTFVFVAGDRDYIPVIQHIQTQARTVKAVAFRGNLSGDLLQNIGERNFIDALTLFDEESLKRLEQDAAYAREAERLREEARQKAQEERRIQEAPPAPVKSETKPGSQATFNPVSPLLSEDQRRCVELMLTEYCNFARYLQTVCTLYAKFGRNLLRNRPNPAVIQSAGASRLTVFSPPKLSLSHGPAHT